MVHEDFGLDVELELAARGEVEYLVEGGDARARNRRLFGKPGITQRAAVPLAQFSQRERADRPRRPGTLAEFRIQQRVVRDYQNIVFGNGHVHLEYVDSGLNGVLESGDGILRPQRAGATMSMHQDRSGSSDGGGHEQQRKYLHRIKDSKSCD